MKKLIILSLLAFIVFAILPSCATIMTGSKQTVKITSEPSEATVFVDGVEIGKTPYIGKIKRNSEFIMLNKDGYVAQNIELKHGINGWYWGDVGLTVATLIGGVVGFVVDLSNGAAYKIKNDEQNIVLKPL